MTDRIRIIHPNKEVTVRDYAFSQVCELTAPLSDEQRAVFYRGLESVILPEDTHFALAGSSLKLMAGA